MVEDLRSSIVPPVRFGVHLFSEVTCQLMLLRAETRDTYLIPFFRRVERGLETVVRLDEEEREEKKAGEEEEKTGIYLENEC